MALEFSGRFGAGDLIFGTDLRDLEVAVQGGEATLYAITGMNGGISSWRLGSGGGAPQLTGQQLHGQAGLQTGDFHLAEVGGNLRLLSGQPDASACVSYRLQADGSLGNHSSQALAGAGADGFDAVAVVQLAGGKAAYYGASQAGGILQGWRLNAGGNAEAQTGRAGADSAYQLQDAVALATVQTAGGPVLLAADAEGLNSYQVNGVSGALTPVGAFGSEQGLAAGGFTALEVAATGGKSWALLGAAGSSSITVMEVLADGDLRFAGQVNDTQASRFGGLTALKVLAVDGHMLMLAAGNDGGLSLFRLTPQGQLIHWQALEQTADLGLQNVTALEAVASGGGLQIFVASGAESGISRFTLPLADLGVVQSVNSGPLAGSPGADLLMGGAGATDLAGHAGDDVLVAGRGGGQLSGGAGADIFVIDPAARQVTVRDFTPGADQLDLSAFEALYSPLQLDVRETGSGIVLQTGETVLTVNSAAGGGLTLADLFGPSLRFTAPDRQGLGDTLPGGGGSTGGGGTGGGPTGGGSTDMATDGADQIVGTSGNDEINGLGGHDSLEGKAGDDTLLGGTGNDSLKGQAGADLLWGGGGADRLEGGKGGDQLAGNGGHDSLIGGGGNDRLEGGKGRDLLRGGGGDDVFVFARGHGRDTVADFRPGRDLLDLGGTGADDFTALAISREDGGTLIGTGSGWIFLEGVFATQLDADDFLF